MSQTESEIRLLAERLFPLHRSQTGAGVRQTLSLLQEFGVDLTIQEIPSHTKAFDWSVPQEWTIRDAFIADEHGNRIVDYRSSNLHVWNGSHPVDTTMDFTELQPHLATCENQIDAMPYRTVFFQEGWGFSVTQLQMALMRSSRSSLHVKIDSEFHDGSLSYGEAFLKGASEEEVLIWTHTCHPSLALVDASGIRCS